MSFSVIIPARYASSRLPGKPLADIAGKPMIQYVWEKAQLAGAKRVIVATDHPQIVEVVKRFGGEVCLTSTEHSSGTERLAEVVAQLQLADDEVVVNIQGDEPMIPPVIVKQVADNLQKYQVNMATLSVMIDDPEELFNPNVVKVLTDKNGYVLYFSRAVIPWQRDQFVTIYQKPEQISSLEIKDYGYQRHIGIYAYKAGFIRQYVAWQPTALEKYESLEQLRVLWNGEKIHCEQALEVPAVGVDTPEDLLKVRELLSR